MFLVVVVLVLCAVVIYRRLQTVKRKAAVVVLGDIGRSPRMLYHSLSLASHQFHVHIVGYGGSELPDEVLKETQIYSHEMKEVPKVFSKFPKLVTYGLKVIWQSLVLLLHLIYIGKSSHILLQNPPCIPSMAVVWFVSCVEGSEMVVDWHNYGYTILGLTLGPKHPLVKFGKWYEKFFGRFSKYNLCVTEAMKTDLQSAWNIKATTLYDRPPSKFKTALLPEQHKLFTKLSKKYDVFKSENEEESETIFTQICPGDNIQKRAHRPALVVSGTSWTEDEDFSILLQALTKYEKQKNDGARIPNIICVITGKGPLKSYYIEEISKMKWKYVKFCTPWLEPEDYPILLGSADLGVCLHTSSSGLDLPMKVVDMFGCALPVCAISFKCLRELVNHGGNGCIFIGHEQLSDQLQDLLSEFPENCHKLKSFRKNLEDFQKVRWSDSWDDHVWPLFQ